MMASSSRRKKGEPALTAVHKAVIEGGRRAALALSLDNPTASSSGSTNAMNNVLPHGDLNDSSSESNHGGDDHERDNDDLLNDIMGNIEGNGEEGEIMELDPEVEQMLAELEKTDEFGENVSAITAKTFKSITQLIITKETTDKLKAELKTPENCKELIVPAVNAPIWAGLPMTARTNDVKHQGLQQNMVRAQIAQMRLMDEILKAVPKEKMQAVLKHLLDSAKCISAAVQDINLKRRHQLRPFLNRDYAGLNSSKVPVTTYLYGDDLEKTMKEAKVTSNIVKSTGNYSNRRHHPFYKNNSQGRSSGNYNRPSQMSSRGGLQYPNHLNQRQQFQRNRQSGPTLPKPFRSNFQRHQ